MSLTMDLTGKMTAHARQVFGQVSGRATALCHRACSEGASSITHYCFVCESAPGMVDIVVLKFADVETDFAGDGWDKVCRESVLAHKPVEGFMRVLCALQDGSVFAGGLPLTRQVLTLSKGGQA